MEKRLDGIESDIKTIKENHLHHMEIDIAHVKTDVSWLMDSHKAQRTILYTILGGIILTLVLVGMGLK